MDSGKFSKSVGLAASLAPASPVISYTRNVWVSGDGKSVTVKANNSESMVVHRYLDEKAFDGKIVVVGAYLNKVSSALSSGEFDAVSKNGGIDIKQDGWEVNLESTTDGAQFDALMGSKPFSKKVDIDTDTIRRIVASTLKTCASANTSDGMNGAKWTLKDGVISWVVSDGKFSAWKYEIPVSTKYLGEDVSGIISADSLRSIGKFLSSVQESTVTFMFWKEASSATACAFADFSPETSLGEDVVGQYIVSMANKANFKDLDSLFHSNSDRGDEVTVDVKKLQTALHRATLLADKGTSIGLVIAPSKMNLSVKTDGSQIEVECECQSDADYRLIAGNDVLSMAVDAYSNMTSNETMTLKPGTGTTAVVLVSKSLMYIFMPKRP
jgi:DNA polymerase III sliding clamp (beta) subunit (PCNA family)